MKNLNLVLYRSINQYSAPEKFLVNDVNGIEIGENDYVYIELQSEKILDIDNSFIWLTDFKFRLYYERELGGLYFYSLTLYQFFNFKEINKFSAKFNFENQRIPFYKIFLNYYGVCSFEYENGTDACQLGTINIVSEKISDVQELFDYLFNKNFFYWNAISLTKLEAEDDKIDKKNILWMLNLIRNFVSVFDAKFLPNIHDTVNRLVPSYQISSYDNANSITEDSLLWLLQNTDHLKHSNSFEESFLIMNKRYTVDEILSQSLLPDTNVHENQVIHGFLNDVFIFLTSTFSIIERKIRDFKDSFSFKAEIHKFYYKKVQSSIGKLQVDIQRIKGLVENNIPVKYEHLNIHAENRFSSKEHYFAVYEEIRKWIERDNANSTPELLFIGTKDISKLYEIFCLFKIIDCLESLDYIKLSSPSQQNKFSPISLLMETEEDYLKAIYKFQGTRNNLNLYYECLPENLSTVAADTSNEYRPDFVIEVIDGEQAISYIILDAKYKKNSAIEKFDYEELCLKYLHGISCKHRKVFPVLGLFIINPIDRSGIQFYQKTNSITSGFNDFPIIGQIESSTKDKSASNLKLLLGTLLNKHYEAFKLIN